MARAVTPAAVEAVPGPPLGSRANRRAALRCSAFGLAALFVLGCGTTDPAAGTTARTEQPISGGELDFENTGVFSIFTHVGGGASLCTGTLIAPNLLLTARHCVSPELGDDEFVVCGESRFGQPYAGSEIVVTNDTVLSQDSTWYRGRDVRVPDAGNDTCGFDIALVILSQNVPTADAKVYVPRIDRVVEAGEVYTAVGYGETGSGPNSSSGGRMLREGLTIQCQPGDCGSGATSTEFLGETGVCSGDSGGPALDSDGRVVGVVSRGSDPCEMPVYGAVSAWSGWLRDVALEAAELGGYSPSYWATTGLSAPPVNPNPTGSGGGAGAPSVTTPQGQACGPDSACPQGYLCYYDSDPSQAACTATCETGCGPGFECRADLGVCAAPAAAPEDSGCAVTPGGGRGSPWAAAAAVGIALMARRRRSR